MVWGLYRPEPGGQSVGLFKAVFLPPSSVCVSGKLPTPDKRVFFCPCGRTKKKNAPDPPPSGEGVVGFSARFSNLDLISHLSDTDRCELLVQIPSMPLVHPCGDATGFRQCLWCTPLDIRECLWCTLWTRDGHCFLPRSPPPTAPHPPTTISRPWTTGRGTNLDSGAG